MSDPLHPLAATVSASLPHAGAEFVLAIDMTVRPEAEGAFRAAFAAATPPTRAEAGCRAYVLAADPARPLAYFLYEQWRSLADLDAHLKTPYIVELLGVLDATTSGMTLRVLLPA